jgi:hypothetical protein
MRRSSTAAHFGELVATNQRLLDLGVGSISLAGLDWGDITVSGSEAEATTWETWITTFERGTEQSRDENFYRLVREGDAWLISTNEHPEASAADAPAPAIVPQRSGSAAASDLPLATIRNHSTNWSGYVSTGGQFTGVSGTWTVPEPQVTGSQGVSATWVGIGGERTRDLIQAGTEETVLPSGRIRYSAWIETLPDPARRVQLPVKAGDSVTVSVNLQSPGVWNIAFKNHTTGGTLDRTVEYDSSFSSAEWIVEAPSSAFGGLLPLSDFGSVRFSDATTVRDGKRLSLADAEATPIAMLNRFNETLALPSVLDASGAGFFVHRSDAAPTVGSRRRAS